MSLKELTADLHEAAENTPFMKAVFNHSLPMKVWEEWTFWRFMFYSIIEDACDKAGLLDDIQGIKRADGLMKDYTELRGMWVPSDDCTNPVLMGYESYLKSIPAEQMLAHLYVWHMGDLYGGQMIKKVIPAPTHYALQFDDASALKNNLRAKLTDDLGPEARVAFEYAIKLLGAVYQG